LVSGDKLFDEIALMTDFIQENMIQWTQKSASSELRWIEVFAYAKQQQRLVENLSLIVEFAFCLSGTSCEVERLFSLLKNVWGPDKGQMKI
jgi:hypothetical protein